MMAKNIEACVILIVVLEALLCHGVTLICCSSFDNIRYIRGGGVIVRRAVGCITGGAHDVYECLKLQTFYNINVWMTGSPPELIACFVNYVQSNSSLIACTAVLWASVFFYFQVYFLFGFSGCGVSRLVVWPCYAEIANFIRLRYGHISDGN